MCYVKQLKILSLFFLSTILLTGPTVLARTADTGPTPASNDTSIGPKISGLDNFTVKYGAASVKQYGHNTKLEIAQGKAQSGEPLDIAAQVLQDTALVFGYEPTAMMYGNQIERKDGSTKVRFCQTYKGLHVYGTCLIVVVDRDKRVQSVQCRTEEKLADVGINPRIDANKALQLAANNLGLQDTSSNGMSEPRLMVLSQGDHSHLVWWLRFNSTQPQGSWVAMVDAVDSSMVSSRNKLDSY